MKGLRFTRYFYVPVILLALSALFVGSAVAIDLVVDLSQGDADVVIRGYQEHAYLGEISAVGDFNGDGIDDLLIGAAGGRPEGRTNAGEAYLVLGDDAMSSLDMSEASPTMTVYGAASGDVLGHSVAAGDVNGDGLSDMVIGADLVDTTAGADTGAVYIFLGRSGGFPGTVNLVSAQADVTILGELEAGRLGRSVVVGDVDGDGIEDILAGAYTASPAGRYQAGAAYVIRGSASYAAATPATIDLSAASNALALKIYGAGAGIALIAEQLQAMEQVNPVFADEMILPDSLQVGDRLGRSVAVGYINQDDNADIVVGAYGADVDGRAEAGRTYVFYGSDSYQSGSTTIDLGGSGTADVTLNGVDAGDQSGFYVGVGQVTAQRANDILISAYYSQGINNSTGDQTGEVFVVSGENLPAVVNLATDATATIYGAAAGGRLGRSLAVGDINADFTEDLLLGASRVDSNGLMDAGEAYVLYGGSGITGAIQLSQPENIDILIQGESGGDTVCDDVDGLPTGDCGSEVGRSISSGDINGDGGADIVVGGLFANNEPLLNTGAVYVIYGEVRNYVFLPSVIK